MIGNWSGNVIDIDKSLMTQGGFVVKCKFSVMLTKVDPVAFRASQMLNTRMADSVALSFVNERLLPLHYKTGFYAFDAYWRSIGISCIRYQIYHDGEDYFASKFDPNACDYLDNAKEVIGSGGGCKLQLMWIKINHTAFVEENYSMLTKEQISQAVKNSCYRKAEEVAAVVALKRELEIKEYVTHALIDTSYENKWLMVTIKGAHGRAIIEWHIKRNSGNRVLGFRLGSSLDGKREKIVDHATDGKISETMSTGMVCNYQLHVGGHEEDTLTFQIRFPTETELNELERSKLRLQDIANRISEDEPVDEATKLREEIRAKVMKKIGSRKALQEVYEDELQRISRIKDRDLQDLEKEVLETVIASLREQDD